MVKGVLFDLDGTLFDRDGAVRDLFTAQHRAFEPELGGIERERFVARLLELDDHGHADKRTSYGRLVRELGLDAALGDTLLAHFRSVYSRFGAPFPDAIATLEALRARGIAIAIVTNGRADTQAAKVERLGLEPFVAATLISEREGIRKPDRRIFELALSRIGVSAEEAWHVGDHPMADVAGAHAAGLTAIWRHVPYWPEPACQAFTIHELSELLPLLDAELLRRQ
ncbi:MAG TPA: HAD family hydrolase [Polyangiaceae bacterium]|nr:HAD family hydrolase [Polyangiaceae bacterium]